MSKESERRVRDAVSNLIGYPFENRLPQLGTSERVDGWLVFNENNWLILELEEGQKHPTTNVLKLLRFLSDNRKISIILAHVYFPNSYAVDDSSGGLATWLGQQMERHYLPERFYYRRLIINREYTEWLSGEDELLKTVAALTKSQSD